MGYSLFEWKVDQNGEVEIHVAGERRKGGVGLGEVVGFDGGRLSYKWIEPTATWWSGKVLHKVYKLPVDEIAGKYFYVLQGGSWKNTYYDFYRVEKNDEGEIVWEVVSRETVVRHFL